MADETTPLLQEEDLSFDPHKEFCLLIGISPSESPNDPDFHVNKATLYGRATRKRKSQNATYNFSAALSNTLLLSQIVLGATLTALGASSSSHVLITCFGVLNTIIAGLVAYFKSRGQPMRARMFRDDLEHVVEEIENSKTMWLGIKHNVHGYNEIDVDDKVSVRSEVARLTRLYESSVKKYMQNNPDMYHAGGGLLDAITGLRARPQGGAQLPALTSAADGGNAAAAAAPAPAPPAADDDESPASAKSSDVKADTKKDDDKKEDDKGKDTDKKKEDDKSKDKDAKKEDGEAKKDGDGKTDADADATAGASSTDKPADDADAEPAAAADPDKIGDAPDAKQDKNGSKDADKPDGKA